MSYISTLAPELKVEILSHTVMGKRQQRSPTASLRAALAVAVVSLRKAALVSAVVVGAPLVVILSMVWATLGALLTLRSVLVAPLATLIAWGIWFVNDAALELPVVTTVGVAVGVLATKGKPLLLTWAFLALFTARRMTSPAHESDNTEHQMPAVCSLLGCLLPGWFYMCKLRLWLPADEQKLHDVEHKIYRRFITDKAFHLTQVAGLGTVHVPYCGELKPTAPPRTIVLMHGYLAGNAFWAAVSGLLLSVDNECYARSQFLTYVRRISKTWLSISVW